MCTSCGSPAYGQNDDRQKEARKKDLEKLNKVRKAADLRSLLKTGK